MKERSVLFYKRLIIFTALSVIVVSVLLLAVAVSDELGFWHLKDEKDETKTIDSSLIVPISPTPRAIDEVVTKEIVPAEEKIAATDGKVVYLTFDDGASSNTSDILGVLKENGVKATFFFNTSEKQTNDDIIRKAHEEGHAIGVLTSTAYNYDTIYSSIENYREDFDKSYDRIYQVTGEKPEILRFPGGSINNYDMETHEELAEEVKNRGLVYFDWNVCAQDASKRTSKETMVENATKLPAKKEKCIVLIHDNGNDNTCAALQEIIRFYKDNGYTFQKLTADVEPIIF